MNILKRPNKKGDKFIFYYDFGRGPGQRPSTGIFIYRKPKDQTQKNHNKEAFALLEEQFQRLTGVKKAAFLKMVEVFEQSILAHRRHASRGRPAKLSVEDQVLMMLMYYREYRPFFPIGKSYGISEVQCWRIVTKVESALIQSPAFRLPGKKQLYRNRELQQQAVVVDASEHPIERPKKNSGSTTVVKRKGIRSRASW